MGGNRDKKKDKKKRPTERRQRDQKKYTDGPNGGVRIGSHRHRQKLRAAERRERDAAAAAAPTTESTAATTTTKTAEAKMKPSAARNRRIRQRRHADQRERPKEVEYDPAKVQREAEMWEQAVDADRELRRKIAQARQKQPQRSTSGTREQHDEGRLGLRTPGSSE
eukprot:COSAG02_NODE_430_length_22462_cov_52.755042_8_plen_166_part_00